MSMFKDLMQVSLESGIESKYESEVEPEYVESSIIDLDETYQEGLNESLVDVCPECGSVYEEGFCPICGNDLNEAVKMVVKNGKVVRKQVKTHKTRISAKQKAALAKARKKSHSSSANKARAKSMKVRSKKIKEAEEFACPVCDYVGSMEEVEDGVFVCPECGAELEVDEEACGSKRRCESRINEAGKEKAMKASQFYKAHKGENPVKSPAKVCNQKFTGMLYKIGGSPVGEVDPGVTVQIVGVTKDNSFIVKPDSKKVSWDDKPVSGNLEWLIDSNDVVFSSANESEYEIPSNLNRYIKALEINESIVERGPKAVKAHLIREYGIFVED